MKRIFLLLLFWLLAPQAALAADAQPARTQASTPHNEVRLWRQVRSGQPGITTVRGIETGVLVQSGGETWRELRDGPITLYGGILLCVVIAGIAAYYALRGPIKLKEARSGRLVGRFTGIERIAHWSMAGSFVILALSGLNMLFGRHLLLPVLGHALFSWVAVLCKNLHNFVGPLFLLSIVVSFLIFVKDNLWRTTDALWLKKLGGLLSGEHVPSGRFNLGEKAWFWLGLVVLGCTVSLSGLVLDFPNFEQGRAIMQWANIVHVVAALLFICLAMGHIYIGSIGMEGALEGMRDGYVDEVWAREHHELWYLDQKQKAAKSPAVPASAASAAQP
ncbi:formate dehydrogenase, cytochrome b556(fdo) subunit [mine drainage metagenome]|uniref:Formate dehydrogenase, cytochrome b556(Fdo) subunit n=1 Tax=mine drainage metagenome TaxID=410659 RepID=A0A1J5S5B9_9ZZZZ